MKHLHPVTQVKTPAPAVDYLETNALIDLLSRLVKLLADMNSLFRTIQTQKNENN
jgi:hypothetical protein